MNATLEVQYRNFQRFEGELLAFLATAPQSWQVKTEKYGLRETTVAARLRDAIASYRKYKWAPTAIDPVRFAQWSTTIRVVVNHKGIFIVDANEYAKELQATAATQGNVSSSNDSSTITVDLAKVPDSLHMGVAIHLAILCHYTATSGVIFRNCKVPLTGLSEHYDVAIAEKPDGSQLMV